MRIDSAQHNAAKTTLVGHAESAVPKVTFGATLIDVSMLQHADKGASVLRRAQEVHEIAAQSLRDDTERSKITSKNERQLSQRDPRTDESTQKSELSNASTTDNTINVARVTRRERTANASKVHNDRTTKDISTPSNSAGTGQRSRPDITAEDLLTTVGNTREVQENSNGLIQTQNNNLSSHAAVSTLTHSNIALERALSQITSSMQSITVTTPGESGVLQVVKQGEAKQRGTLKELIAPPKSRPHQAAIDKLISKELSEAVAAGKVTLRLTDTPVGSVDVRIERVDNPNNNTTTQNDTDSSSKHNSATNSVKIAFTCQDTDAARVISQSADQLVQRLTSQGFVVQELRIITANSSEDENRVTTGDRARSWLTAKGEYGGTRLASGILARGAV